jgi:hypothetical protein
LRNLLNLGSELCCRARNLPNLLRYLLDLCSSLRGGRRYLLDLCFSLRGGRRYLVDLLADFSLQSLEVLLVRTQICEGLEPCHQLADLSR